MIMAAAPKVLGVAHQPTANIPVRLPADRSSTSGPPPVLSLALSFKEREPEFLS